MTYLLDVNALLALGLREHEHHERVADWVKHVTANEGTKLASCAITELGFLRILTGATSYNFTITQGKALLLQLRAIKELPFIFLTDHLGIANLPSWVKWPKQITDGHLVELARSHGATLATLDERIPRAMLIPGRR